MGGARRALGALMAALIMTTALSMAARADDFVAVCTAANKNDAAQQKACTCMSGKVTDDRDDFIDMMKMLNEAQAKGTELDPAKLEPDEVKILAKVMETLAACFQ